MIYKEIADVYAAAPKDVYTVHKDGSVGKWFFVYAENNVIYAAPAKDHRPSSSMRYPIGIKEDEYEDMLRIYRKRLRGIAVSREAKAATRAQVYWYGIFNDLGL